MTRCIRCILPETFPGITFDQDGVCNFCLAFTGQERLDAERERMREKFEQLVDQIRGRSTYDALMCYSGGKDSSYTLSLLRKQLDLRVLAVTLDNGFIPDQTFINIRKVCDALCVDHLLVKPRFDVLRRIFAAASERTLYPRKTLERASTICTSCIAFVKFGALRLSIEKEIPIVCYGWSPGQAPTVSSVFKHNPAMLRSMQRTLYDPMHEIVGDDIRPYFLEQKHFSDPSEFPHNASPLAFYEYDEEKILKEITSMGWRRPEGLDANSSNCLLNSYANLVHKRQFGFNPYVWEMANMVRTGQVNRRSALEKITSEVESSTLGSVAERLGLTIPRARQEEDPALQADTPG